MSSTWRTFGRPVCDVVSVLFTSDRRVFFGHDDGTIRQAADWEPTRCCYKCSPAAIRFHERTRTLPNSRDAVSRRSSLPAWTSTTTNATSSSPASSSSRSPTSRTTRSGSGARHSPRNSVEIPTRCSSGPCNGGRNGERHLAYLRAGWSVASRRAHPRPPRVLPARRRHDPSRPPTGGDEVLLQMLSPHGSSPGASCGARGCLVGVDNEQSTCEDRSATPTGGRSCQPELKCRSS